MDEQELDALYDSHEYLLVLPVFAVGQHPMPADPLAVLRGLIRGEITMPDGHVEPTVAFFTDEDLAERFIAERFPGHVEQMSPIRFASPDDLVQAIDVFATMGIEYVSLDSRGSNGYERFTTSATVAQFRTAIARVR